METIHIKLCTLYKYAKEIIIYSNLTVTGSLDWKHKRLC